MEGPVDPEDPAPGSRSFLERRRRELIARRFPLFAFGWLATMALWLVVFALEGRFTVPVVVIVGLQAAILTIAAAALQSLPGAPRVPVVAVTACVFLGVSSSALFASIHGYGEVLIFVLFSLHLAAALIFCWGWRAELVLQVSTLVPYVLVLSAFDFLVPPLDLVAAATIGSLLSLAVAEGSARSLRFGLRGEASAAEMTRELAASRDAYRDLAENARDFIWTADLDGRLTYVNDAIARYQGLRPDEIVGRHMSEFLTDHPENPDPQKVLGRLMFGAMDAPLHVEGTTPQGPRWFEVLGSAVHAPDGTVVGVRAISRDVTERRWAAERLRESEERYRGLLESQRDIIVRFGFGETITFVNDAFCQTFGIAREEAIGTTGAAMRARLLHPDDLAASEVAIATLLRPPHRGRVENRNRTPDGWRWISWETGAIRDARGHVVEVHAVGRDVTERKVTEEALRTSLEELRRGEEKLRLLAQHQATIREEERKRLGFDLHDDVCQELVGVGILVESLRRKMAPMPAEHAAEFDRVVGYLGEVVEHLRLLARELRPMMLRDLGLDGSLRSLADGMSSATTRVATEFRTPIPRLDEEAEVTVYRIAQEALANATRHAGARSIVVSLAATDGRLCLEVQDDGCGFDPAAPRAEALGLVSMEERAQALGGRLELKSAPGAGTTVRLECPATRAPASAA